jgi:hypothetical protein
MISIDAEFMTARIEDVLDVSSQKVGANPCGCPPGQVQDLPLPQVIEKILLDDM